MKLKKKHHVIITNDELGGYFKTQENVYKIILIEKEFVHYTCAVYNQEKNSPINSPSIPKETSDHRIQGLTFPESLEDSTRDSN